MCLTNTPKPMNVERIWKKEKKGINKIFENMELVKGEFEFEK